MDTPARHREATVSPRLLPCGGRCPDHPTAAFPHAHREGDGKALALLSHAQLEGPVMDGAAASKDGPDHCPSRVQGRLVPQGGGKLVACGKREGKVGGRGLWQPSRMVAKREMESQMDLGGSGGHQEVV